MKAANLTFLKMMSRSGGFVVLAWGCHAVSGGRLPLPMTIVVALGTLLLPVDPDETGAAFYTRTIGLQSGLVLVAAAAFTPNMTSPDAFGELLRTLGNAALTCPTALWVPALLVSSFSAALQEGAR